jgi:hypothetical protein
LPAHGANAALELLDVGKLVAVQVDADDVHAGALWLRRR